MGEVWAFCEGEGRRLHRTAPQIASEAKRVAEMLEGKPCGLLGIEEGAEGTEGLVQELWPFGLKKIYLIRGNAPPPWTPEVHAQALTALAQKHHPQFLLFAATPLGSEVAARVTARLGSGLISNCVDFTREGEKFVARKAACGGKVHMTCTWLAPEPYVATVELGSLEAVEERAPQEGEAVEERVEIAPLRTELVRRWRVDPREVDLTEASVVIGIGRPIIARAEEVAMMEEVAERLGAAFGASRAVVDSGLLPKEKQIGASGKWLSADVYLACGISGSSYHMMGVKGVRHLVAVNTDRNAPIFKFAELGVAGDLFEVLPALAGLLDAGKEACPEPS